MWGSHMEAGPDGDKYQGVHSHLAQYLADVEAARA